MSHNVTVQGVIFDDVQSLEKAFNELRAGNPALANAKFHAQPFEMRGYGGRRERVDCGIELPNDRYDVGFRKGPDGLVPYFESGFAPTGLAADLAAKTVEGQACPTYHGPGAVGKLAQRYRVIQLERNAQRNGMQTRRVNKAHGQIGLEIVSR